MTKLNTNYKYASLIGWLKKNEYIRESKYFSSTLDISHEEQTSFIIQYVDVLANLEEFFFIIP